MPPHRRDGGGAGTAADPLVAGLVRTAGFVVRSAPALRGRGRLAFGLHRRLGRACDFSVVVPMTGDHVVRLPMTSAQSWRAAFTGRYDDELIASLTPLIRPGSLVLDVGASLGLYTVPLGKAAARVGARVLAFEPLRANRVILSENLERNGLSAFVDVVPVALGRADGSVVMHAEPGGVGNGAIVTGLDGDEVAAHDAAGHTDHVEGIAVRTLDDVLSAYPQPVSLMKLDVEGFEFDVLEGGQAVVRRDRPVILAEFNRAWLATRGATPDALAAWVDEHGYRPLEVRGQRRHWWSDERSPRLEPPAAGTPGHEGEVVLVPREAGVSWPAGSFPRPLLLGDEWHENHPGGLNRYLGELLGALEAIGAEPMAVVLGPAMGAPFSVCGAGRRDQPLPGRLWHLRRSASRLAGSADVIDAHFVLNAFWPVVFGGARRMPLVVHFQGPWAEESAVGGQGGRWAIRVKRLVETAVYRRADRLVVLSTAFKRILVERYGVSPWRVHVVPPGVDLGRFHPGAAAAARRGLGVPEGVPVAVTVRRLVPRMGLEVLLESWSTLLVTHPRALLLVAGEGPGRAALEALAGRLGIGAHVRFLGRVDDETLVRCYQAADVAVVPSLALEGFGLTVLEALACGTPVVASDVDGLPEALAPLDPSLVIPAGDPAALAERLGAGLDGTSPWPDGEHCRRYAESFTWERAARANSAVYTEARSPSPPKPRVVYLDHCALLSGGELALLALIPALSDVEAHVVLAGHGPLVTKLMQAGVSVEVLAMAESARGLSRDRVRASRLPWRSALRSTAYVLRLAVRLRRLRPDLVHTNSLKSALYGGLAARLAGVPVVWHVRDRIAPDYLPATAVQLVQALSRRIPTAVIANSRTTMATLGRASVGSEGTNRRVIHDAVRLPSGAGRMARTPSGGGDEPHPLRVGMLGRLSPWKGQHVFIDAFASAFPDGPEEAVVIGSALFGEEDYERQLRRRAGAADLAGRVDFRGFREDVATELARLDIVVHASVIPEPFGLVVVEAMAMGIPVIAAAAGGPAEVIQDDVTGVLVEPGDVTALAAAIRRLAADPTLRGRLGAAGRRRSGDFAPGIVAGQVMALYRGILGPP